MVKINSIAASVICLLVSTTGLSAFLTECNLDCNHGSCHHHKISHEAYCRCYSGYTGNRCDVKASSSSGSSDCDLDCNNGHCHISYSSHTKSCRCDLGYSGERCDHHSSGSNNCVHGSTSGFLHICICEPGWAGAKCDTADPCLSNPCQNGGTCGHHLFDQITLQHICTCKTGYSGADCEVAPLAVTVTTSKATTTTTTHTPMTTVPMTSEKLTTTKATAATTVTTPSPPPTTTTTTAATTVTQSVPLTYYCPKFDVINDIAVQKVSNNPAAAPCPNGQQVSPEAFVLDHCNTTIPALWRKGINVMSTCQTIDLYTPIAMFPNGLYQPSGPTCGIFLGCLQNGFKIGIQTCGSVPLILHAETGTSNTINNPNDFFVIR